MEEIKIKMEQVYLKHPHLKYKLTALFGTRMFPIEVERMLLKDHQNRQGFDLEIWGILNKAVKTHRDVLGMNKIDHLPFTF